MRADSRQVSRAYVQGEVAVMAQDPNPRGIAMQAQPPAHVLSSHRLRSPVCPSTALHVIKREKDRLGFATADTGSSVGSHGQELVLPGLSGLHVSSISHNLGSLLTSSREYVLLMLTSVSEYKA